MKVITFDEAKDILATNKLYNGYQFKNWDEATKIDHDFLFDHYEEVAELYANSLAAKAWKEAFISGKCWQETEKNGYAPIPKNPYIK